MALIAISILVAFLIFFITKVYLQLKQPLPRLAVRHEKNEDVIKQSFTEESVPSSIDVLVIGSGMGGLTSAALLAKYGKKVLVLEQHDIAGGCTHSYKDHGFEFDTGLHYVSGGNMPHNLFTTITDGKLQFAKTGDVYDIATIYNPSSPSDDNETFKFRSGISNLKSDLKLRFPKESSAIDAYISLCLKHPQSFGGLMISKMLPSWLTSLLSTIPFFSSYFKAHLPLASRTVYDVLSSLTSDEKLINLLSYLWGDYGLPPKEANFGMHALVCNSYLRGAFYPIGGSSEIASGAVSVIEKTGGKVLVRAKVTQILLSSTSPSTAIGVRVGYGYNNNKQVDIFAPEIISSIGALNTYLKLLAHDAQTTTKISTFNKRITPSFAFPANNGRLGAVQPSLGHVYVFIGFDGSPEELGLTGSNYWVFPSWDHDKNHQQWLESPSLEEALKKPLPAAFLSFSCAKDPEWSSKFPGKSTAIVLTEARYDWFENHENEKVRHRGQEYQDYKEQLKQPLLDILFHYFPQTKGRVVYTDVGTPLSNNHYIGTFKGEAYGLEFSPSRFTPEIQLMLGPETHIKNLFLSGQDVLTNGVTGALLTGFITAVRMYPGVLWQNLNIFSKGF